MKHSILNYDKYIGQDKNNLQVLSSLLDKPTGTISIVKAKPGAGKSNAMIEISKERAKKNKNDVYLMATPFKMQVQQASKSYQVYGYFKGIKFDRNERVAFCIYDRLKEVAIQYKNEGYKVHIILDESHLIHGAYDYRKRAIEGIVSLVNDYPVIMVTATPRLNLIADRLGILKIDQLVECVSTKEKEKHITKILDVSSKNRGAIISEIIEEQSKIHDLTIVRLNNKNMIDLLEEELQVKGHKVGVVYTGLSENKEGVLTNIVENETILNDYDIVLTTCKLDVGSNVNQNHKNICMLHASLIGSDCDLDALEQFPDRMRNGFKTHIILTCSNYEKEARDFKAIYDAEFKICKAKLDEAKIHFNYMCMYDPPHVVLKRKTLTNTDMSGESLSDYCIDLDTDNTLVLDEFKLLSRANRKYSEMLYRRPDVLERVLMDYGIAQEVEFEVYNPQNIAKTIEVMKETREEQKSTRIRLDNLLDEHIKVLYGANDLMLGGIFEGIEEHMPKQYQEAYEFIANEYPKLLRTIYECLKAGYTHREIMNVLYENAHKPKRDRKSHGSLLKDLRLKMQYLEFNNLYRKGRHIEIIDGSLGNEYRKIMEYMKGKKNPYLSNDLLEELTIFINKSKGKKDKKIDIKATKKALISMYKLDNRNRLVLRTRREDLFL